MHEASLNSFSTHVHQMEIQRQSKYEGPFGVVCPGHGQKQLHRPHKIKYPDRIPSEQEQHR